MTSHTAKTPPVTSAESVSDISQESKRQKRTSQSIGSQKKLFLRTAPVSSLFKLKSNRCNYASLQRLEYKERLKKDCYQISRSVIYALKHPEYYEFPFHFCCFEGSDEVYLRDSKGRIIEKLYVSRNNALIAGRLININSSKRMIYSILDFNKPTVTVL